MSDRSFSFAIPSKGNIGASTLTYDPPPGWKIAEYRADGVSLLNKGMKLFVIVSASTEQDGKRWLHISVSHRSRLPNYDELAYIKKHFIGPDRYAVSVWPPDEDHVNIHPNCLHLWHCLDGHPLPEFSRGLGTI